MRVLLDSCVWQRAAQEVRAGGHDVDCVSAWGGDPGDEEILRRSVEDDRVLVTLDKDFGELVFLLGQPHRGILRLVSIRAREQGRMILDVLGRFGRQLEQNALVVVEADRIRIRLPAAETE